MKQQRCPQCGSHCEYEISTVWEGNREREEYYCPKCGYLLDSVVTDRVPNVRIIEEIKEL